MIAFLQSLLCCCSLAAQTLGIESTPVRAFPAPSPSPQRADSLTDTAARDALVQHIPGLAVLVSDHGHVTIHTYGYSDLAKHTAVTQQTRFEIGSTTKQFTAACVLQLVELKKISLEDTLSKFIPSYTRARNVTVRQLLGQVSGIPEYLDGTNIVAESGKPITFDALLALVSNKPLLFTPGTSWDYSNTNYLILGRIIEIVSHQTYETYLRDHILAPANLNHTGFIDDGETAMRSRGYTLQSGQVLPSQRLDASWAWSAGGLVSTVGDLLAWDDALLSGSIITPADVELMRTSGHLMDGSETGYGFGWFVDSENSSPLIWHGGNTWGFASTNVTYPKDDQIIIVLANLNQATPNTIASAIFADLHPEKTVALSKPRAAPEPARLYTKSVAAMRTLPIPAFVTYNSTWASTGSGFNIYQDDRKIVLSVGIGREFTRQHEYSVAYRNADRMLAVDEASNTGLVGRGTLFDPTWAGAYDMLRYGLSNDAPLNAVKPETATPSGATAEPPTIATVAAIAPAFYNVAYRGPGRCPSGSVGHVLKLTALRDVQRHPLTEVTIDDSNDLFCKMRFNLNQSGVVGVTGTYELHFSQSGAYWVVVGGAFDLAVRFFGISARHVALRWDNSDISTLLDLPVSTFESPTPIPKRAKDVGSFDPETSRR